MTRLVYGVQPVLEALRSKPDQVEKVLVAEGVKLHALPIGLTLSALR